MLAWLFQPVVFKKLWFYTELHQNFEESLLKYQDLLENQPYCCCAWFNLGLTLAALGRWQEALDALEYAFMGPWQRFTGGRDKTKRLAGMLGQPLDWCLKKP